MQFIDLKTQYQQYKEEIDAAMHQVLDHGQYIMGPEVESLEEQLAQYVGSRYVLGVSSGTDAPLMALMALGVGPGDEVITTPFSFIATAEVIALLGAKPVFVDIEPQTYNLDVEQLEAAITPRTKVIFPVSLFGQMPDFSRINSIADKHGIAVIEDAAQSFGASQNGKKSCGVSTIGTTSFFPAKPLGCYGDGGAIFTNDEKLYHHMKALRIHGGEQRDHYEYIGINGRLDTLQAAVLFVKLKYFDQELKLRQQVADRYNEQLADVCTVPQTAEGNTHAWAQYTIRVSNREALRTALQAHDIPTAVYYPKCLHQQPAYAYLGNHSGSFPVAEKMADEVVSLPMHPWLKEEDQEVIIRRVKESLVVPA